MLNIYYNGILLSDHRKSTSFVCERDACEHTQKKNIFFLNIYIHGLSESDKRKFLTQTEMCHFFPFHSALCKNCLKISEELCVLCDSVLEYNLVLQFTRQW